MAEAQYQITVNGQEVEQADVNLLGKTAGLADDRVFAELLRIHVYEGSTIYKRVIPFGVKTDTLQIGTVQSSLAANGSVIVNPFRAVIGPRVAAGTDHLANWRDIRSAIYVGTNAANGTTIALAANASGNPRWDLVYASVTIDAATATVTRKIKDPTTQIVTSTPVSVTLAQTITVSVLAGTPGASPVIPTLPADSAPTYNIPLAAVRVVNGFAAGTILSSGNIRDYVNGVTGSDVGMLQGRFRSANGNNDGAGTYAANFPWTAATDGLRPGPFLPPTWNGTESVMVALDLVNNAAPSHPNAGVIDSSIDWRGRYFITFVSIHGASTKFAHDRTASGTAIFPEGDSLFPPQMGQSVKDETTGYGTVCSASGAPIAGGATVGVSVDMATGNLVALWNGSPAVRVLLWIQATGPFPNNN